ncbi:unnamed protein product [Cercospora beticola]|nr:unnamed protein product [Cercospora beticola]
MLTIAACGAAAHAVKKHHKGRKAAQQVQAHNAIQQALVDKANGIIAQQQAALQAAEEENRLQQQQQQQAYPQYPPHQQSYAASAYGQPPPPTAQHLPPPPQPYQYSSTPGTPYSAPATPYSAGPPTPSPYSGAMTPYQQQPAAPYHHIGWCSRQCGNTCNGNANSTYPQQTQSAPYQSYGASQPPPYGGYQQGYR